ncbi:TIGR02680 family protein [Streptomyces sp. NBC_01429]|uniref:TIGR02680 family protein n=1 Tax=Streptomyces sp. NBC_01429 TaxID=2903862 RepID=UPI002E2931C8|nr:TIGR02680 family protein [Streptomyces sp. NBC_01429]
MTQAPPPANTPPSPIPAQRSTGADGAVAAAPARFRLHRAGIRNVWQYDEQEFAFGDGRLLLRGKNGAGKSKALEMLLPYLLDGDSRALDATGTGRTTLAWLMLDGFERTNRMGYLWVEFRRATAGGGDSYLTLGAAIRASQSTKRAVPSFFVTPMRVGADLHLVDGGRPLPLDRLKEAVGAENVTDRAVEHRSRVARELFGITDTARYRNLTQLLHRLRRPTVGDRIESGGLVPLLSETLPGLDDEVVEKVARNLHDLDAVREELGRLERTDTALRTFLTTYSGYLTGVLLRGSEGVRQELDTLVQRRREAGDAAKRTAGLRAREAGADERLLSLREERRAATAELDALRASEGYRSVEELSERRSTVTALGSAAGTAFAALIRAHSAEEDAAERLERGARRLGGRLGELATEHRTLLAQAERAGLPVAHLGEPVALARTDLAGATREELTDPDGGTRTVRHAPAGGVDAVAAERALRAWRERLEGARTVARNRSRTVQDVAGLAALAREAQARAARADADRERLEEETEQAAGRLAESREAIAEESRLYAREAASWVRRAAGAAGPDCPPLEGVLATVAHETSPYAPFAERVLPAGADTAVEEAARAALDPYGEELTARRDALAVTVSRYEEERDRLSGEKADWERRTDPEPSVPYHRAAGRAPGTGAPLYRLVDFVEGLSPSTQAGLEAALEASGLLDAWVPADGALIDPLTCDILIRHTLLQPGVPAHGGPTLAEALRPAPHPESGVSAERVARVLAAVALVPAEDTARATAATSTAYYDGSWRLGALRGRHMKDAAQYVGAAVRAETRRRGIAELARRLAEVDQLLAADRERLAEAERRRRELAHAWREFPRTRRLAGAWTRAEGDENAVRELTGRTGRAARAAEEARTRAVAARGEAEATASAHGLPTDPDGLARVGTALTALAGGLDQLGRAVGGTAEGLGGSRTEQAGYERARADRSETEGEYRARLDELRPARQALRTLEETIGSAKDEILAREERTGRRIASAVRALPVARAALDEVRAERVRAEESEKRCREVLVGQEAAVIEAGGRLRGALARPEVVRGAGLEGVSGAGLGSIGGTAAGAAEGAGGPVPPDDAPGRALDHAPGADVRSRVRALRELADTVRERLTPPRREVSDSTLLNRHTELRDQLAGGYDAQLDERDGIKICRLVDDHGHHDVALVGTLIADKAAEARGRLTDREREVFRRFLTGELGDHLSTQVIAAAQLVAALNDTLRTVRTSHGLGVELRWKLDEDADADVRAAVGLLSSPSGLRTREQTEQLREVLQRRIEEARRADPSAGYAAHLRTALDYRDWFRFHTFVVEDAAPRRRRRLTGRTGLSQGEQRVLSYLVLFAAAAAHFTTLGESAPHAPRLILLDDAFAKVDEPTHGRLGRILVDLDLDFVLTSERLMGNWPQVPSLHIYECLRDPHVRGVATLHYTWNGHRRHLVSS